jgi:CheY-like chemotaxis protein
MKNDYNLNLLKGKEILVVEDSYLNREIITKILRRNNLKTVTADNGEEAIAKLKSSIQQLKPFALVLLDITLPGNIDGFDVAEYIKNDPCLRRTEIIVISKSQKASDRERFQQLGVFRFYPKPLSETDLIDAIRDALFVNQGEPAMERYQQNESLIKVEKDHAKADNPKVNLQRLFKDLDKNQDDMEKILSLFEKDLLRLLKDIELAIKVDRMAEASILLHSLQGQCGLVDMYSVNDIAQQLEILTANNQSSKVEQILPALGREVREALSEMQIIRIVSQ